MRVLFWAGGLVRGGLGGGAVFWYVVGWGGMGRVGTAGRVVDFAPVFDPKLLGLGGTFGRVLAGGGDGENDLDCRKDLVPVCVLNGREILADCLAEKPLGEGVCRRTSCWDGLTRNLEPRLSDFVIGAFVIVSNISGVGSFSISGGLVSLGIASAC